MKLIFLGAGGSVSMPRPFCTCPNCTWVRKSRKPWARAGPALLVEDEAILFDTPEDIRLQFEKFGVKDLKHVFYTHWHPDHTQGLRIFEHINFTYPGESARPPINVYVPKDDFDNFVKFCAALPFFEKMGYISIKKFEDRLPIKLGKITVTPLNFRRPDRIRYGFLIEDGSKKAIYAPCSIFGAYIDEYWQRPDLLVMETGWLGKPKDRERLAKGHYWLDHICFEENIAIARKVRAKRTIMTHLEGTRHKFRDADPEFLKALARKHKELNLSFAYDGMKVEL